MQLSDLIHAITAPDETARQAAHARWAACAKPLGGLGLLETAVEDIAALVGTADLRLDQRAVCVLCADNGVVAQGISQAPSSVTAVVARNLAACTTPVCRMAQAAHCDVVPVDMGILDFSPVDGVLDRRIANGTGDISLGAAMTKAQAEAAILAGVSLVCQLKAQGYVLLAAGEMGIGNTTTASALTAVLLDRSVEEMTGRGAGLSDAALDRKYQVIHQAIRCNRPDPADALDVLAKLGGFDIAGMCGLFLGGAYYRIPILIDGVISAAAALCAQRLCPGSAKAMVASHVSSEPAGQALLEALGKKPLISAGLHLGEGTGAVAAMPLLDMALAVYHSAQTFDGCGIRAYESLGGQPCP